MDCKGLAGGSKEFSKSTWRWFFIFFVSFLILSGISFDSGWAQASSPFKSVVVVPISGTKSVDPSSEVTCQVELLSSTPVLFSFFRISASGKRIDFPVGTSNKFSCQGVCQVGDKIGCIAYASSTPLPSQPCAASTCSLDPFLWCGGVKNVPSKESAAIAVGGDCLQGSLITNLQGLNPDRVHDAACVRQDLSNPASPMVLKECIGQINEPINSQNLANMGESVPLAGVFADSFSVNEAPVKFSVSSASTAASQSLACVPKSGSGGSGVCVGKADGAQCATCTGCSPGNCQSQVCTTVIKDTQSLSTEESVTQSIKPGDKIIAVVSGAAFRNGDEILIHQTSAESESQAGLMELVTIETVNGNTFSLTRPVEKSFVVSGINKVQIARADKYEDVIIQSGGVLTTAPWDGARGGILAMKFRTLTVDGKIEMSGKGFREGDDASPGGFGGQGESFSGRGTQGPSANKGGGGGGHPTIGGWTSSGDSFGARFKAGGGAGGGYATQGVNGGPGGSSTPSIGGGVYGIDDLTQKIFLGSGGGTAGWGGAPKGGRGGGIIWISADKVVMSGTIEAKGADGNPSTSTPQSGGGGGGSGGSVVILSSSLVSTSSIIVSGGNGGSGSGSNNPGGKGGDGRIKITKSFDAVSCVASPPPQSQAINLAGGSIKIDVMPTWNGNDGETHRFVDYRIDDNNKIVLEKSGANNMSCLHAVNGIVTQVATPVADWGKGSLHSVVMSWDLAKQAVSCTVDGRLLSKPILVPVVPVQVASELSCINPPSGLVSLLQGEGDGKDSKGVYPGVLENGVGFDVGFNGKGFLFDGVNDFIRIQDSQQWKHEAQSISLWVRPKKIQNSYVLIREQATTINGNEWVSISGTSIGYYFFGGNSKIESSKPLVVDQWSHVAVTRSGGSSGTARVFVNGVEVASGSFSNLDVFNVKPFLIGGDPSYQFWFNGVMDDLQFFNRELSISEIKSLANPQVKVCLPSSQQTSLISSKPPETKTTPSLCQGKAEGASCPEGTCRSGVCVATISGSVNIGAQASIQGTISAGAVNIPVDSVTGFEKGMEVLIHQTASGALSGVGTYDIGVIASISGSTITLEKPLKNQYNGLSGADRAQVVKIFLFEDLRVDSSGVVTSNGWNGATGGISALRVTKSLTLDGSIDMNGKGFGGGRGFCALGLNVGGQGESFQGRGGQSCSNNLGAGGGGDGVTNAGSRLKPSNGYYSSAAGGGGGGHATGGVQGAKGVGAGCGGRGGSPGISYGAPDSSRINIGSGGGAGGGNQGWSGRCGAGGGPGGGIVVVIAPESIIKGKGSIQAKGQVGGASNGGGGGGGGGGTILLLGASGVALGGGGLTITADAGPGGSGGARGGSGGNGRVISVPASSLASVTGAVVSDRTIVYFSEPLQEISREKGLSMITGAQFMPPIPSPVAGLERQMIMDAQRAAAEQANMQKVLAEQAKSNTVSPQVSTSTTSSGGTSPTSISSSSESVKSPSISTAPISVAQGGTVVVGDGPNGGVPAKAQFNITIWATTQPFIVYCTRDGKWLSDLDRKDKSSCEAAGLKWTGYYCCGEFNDRLEFYNDPKPPLNPVCYPGDKKCDSTNKNVTTCGFDYKFSSLVECRNGCVAYSGGADCATSTASGANVGGSVTGGVVAISSKSSMVQVTGAQVTGSPIVPGFSSCTTRSSSTTATGSCASTVSCVPGEVAVKGSCTNTNCDVSVNRHSSTASPTGWTCGGWDVRSTGGPFTSTVQATCCQGPVNSEFESCTVRTNSFTSAGSCVSTASCQSGEIAVGGGCENTNCDASVSQASGTTSWSCGGNQEAGKPQGPFTSNAFVTCCKTKPPVSIAPAPFAWWKFDENSGTLARDSSGNGFDGRLVGSDCVWSAGALNLGPSCLVNVPYPPNWALTSSPRSFIFWTKLFPSTMYTTFFSIWTTNPFADWFFFHPDQRSGLMYQGEAAHDSVVRQGNVQGWDTTQWHQVALISTGTVMNLYLDGTVVASSAEPLVSQSLPKIEFNGLVAPLKIGFYSPNEPARFMSQFRVFNTALTTQQITDMYAAEKPSQSGAAPIAKVPSAPSQPSSAQGPSPVLTSQSSAITSSSSGLSDFSTDTPGSCWNSTYLGNGLTAPGTNEKIASIIGRLFGCSVPSTDEFLLYKDAQVYLPLIQPVKVCTLAQHIRGIQGFNLFCSAKSGKWESTSNDSTRKLVANPSDASDAECCPEGTCWDGKDCVSDQTNDPSLKNINGFRCVAGQWQTGGSKLTPNRASSGFCPRITQCLVNPRGDSSRNDMPDFAYSQDPSQQPGCIADGQFFLDNFCLEGNWSSRAKALSLELIDMGERVSKDNYAVFCGDYEGVLNFIEYSPTLGGDQAKDYMKASCTKAGTTIPCVNNFCAVRLADNKLAFTTSLNVPINDPSRSFLKALGLDPSVCDNAITTDGLFHECTQPWISYNHALQAVLVQPQKAPIKVTGAITAPMPGEFTKYQLKKSREVFIDQSMKAIQTFFVPPPTTHPTPPQTFTTTTPPPTTTTTTPQTFTTTTPPPTTIIPRIAAIVPTTAPESLITQPSSQPSAAPLPQVSSQQNVLAAQSSVFKQYIDNISIFKELYILKTPDRNYFGVLEENVKIDLFVDVALLAYDGFQVQDPVSGKDACKFIEDRLERPKLEKYDCAYDGVNKRMRLAAVSRAEGSGATEFPLRRFWRDMTAKIR